MDRIDVDPLRTNKVPTTYLSVVLLYNVEIHRDSLGKAATSTHIKDEHYYSRSFYCQWRVRDYLIILFKVFYGTHENDFYVWNKLTNKKLS